VPFSYGGVMSRKDARKALEVRVPIALRRRIEAAMAGPRRVPFAAKVRSMLRRALVSGASPAAMPPGDNRATLLQLSEADLSLIEGLGGEPEDTVLGLLAAVLAEGNG
jgi:hypothetical protein